MTAVESVDPHVGLCATCSFARIVRSDKGSEFIRCAKSESDPRFARYPRLPMLRCAGYDPVADA